MKYKYLIYKDYELIYDSEEEGGIYSSSGVFDYYEDAEHEALEWMSAWQAGGETLHLSNPGDYDMPDEDCLTHEIEEIDED